MSTPKIKANHWVFGTAARMGILQESDSPMQYLVDELRQQNEEDCESLEKMYRISKGEI